MDAAADGDPITPEWCAEHFDHLDPRFGRELHDTLAQVRETGAVVHSDQHLFGARPGAQHCS